jgi:hypothetical protein
MRKTLALILGCALAFGTLDCAREYIKPQVEESSKITSSQTSVWFSMDAGKRMVYFVSGQKLTDAIAMAVVQDWMYLNHGNPNARIDTLKQRRAGQEALKYIEQNFPDFKPGQTVYYPSSWR